MAGVGSFVMRLGVLVICVGVFGSVLQGDAGLAEAADCVAAGQAAELADGLPAKLLVSIGMVESGRVDAVSNRVAPWPWAVNVDGAGHFFADEADAAAFVRLAQSSGARDVDVGCFQVSLEQHPDAFGSLDAAFDPVANANFAGRFLVQLKTQSGSWNAAIADYHSALPELGLPYQRLVLAAWRGMGAVPPVGDDLDFAGADPVVILEGPEARLVRVITMDGESGPAMRRGLPVVITP